MMSLQFNARTFSSGAEMKQAHAAIRARLFAKGKASHEASPPAAKPVQKPFRVKEPAPKFYDQHVRDYMHLKVQFAGSPVRYHIFTRCIELGVTFIAVRSQSRKRRIADVRHLLMWEVRTMFGISYPEIGRIFGNRDHSSCLHAIRRVQAAKDESGTFQIGPKKRLLAEDIREFLLRLRDGAPLAAYDAEQNKTRRKVRMAGYATYIANKRRWLLTQKGRAALEEDSQP